MHISFLKKYFYFHISVVNTKMIIEQKRIFKKKIMTHCDYLVSYLFLQDRSTGLFRTIVIYTECVTLSSNGCMCSFAV